MSDLKQPVNAADLTAAAYGRRRPRLPVITETAGLALVLLVNRNTSRDRAVWLTDPDISDALCTPAEAFAQALDGREASPAGWRGGALASLRSLAPGALQETAEPWPYTVSGEPDLVARFWLADDPDRYRWGWEQYPARTELLRLLAGHPRIEPAWQALKDALLNRNRPDRVCSWYASLCAWSCAHESPSHTRWLHGQLAGLDTGPEAALARLGRP